MKLIVKLKEKKTEEILNEIRKISKITHNISLTNYIGVEIEEKRLKDLKKLEFVEEVREPGIARAMLSSAASERCHYLHNSKLCIRSVILDILYKWLHKMNHYIDKTIKTVSDKFPQDYINWIMGSSFKLVEKLGTEIPTKTRHNTKAILATLSIT